jgi:pantoate--beta-alanine ligase
MQVITTIAEMRFASAVVRRAGKRVGLVPTMGALHEGHLSLVRAAKQRCDVIVVSVFVNPTQFGPNEDFNKYPRDLDRDRELLAREGVNIVFAPATEEMYPLRATTFVTVEGLDARNEGRMRPGHYRGVATIVTKLFHIVQPDAAFFGQKDAGQLALIRKLVADLNMPVAIVGCPIVREADGLAMSSRNAYLSVAERKQALVLHRALAAVEAAYKSGERDAAALARVAQDVFATEPTAKPDYIEVLDPATLLPVARAQGETLVAVAARVGTTRLLDNVLLK